MVLISHKYKFIYIKNEKVAGSSVESFFGKFCINPKKEYKFDDSIKQSIDTFGIVGSRAKGIEKNDLWKNHINALTIKRQIGDDKFNTYFKFAIIRNPYDVMVSSYFFQKPELSFKEYAKKRIINNLDRCMINGKNVCDYYIKYENLLEDIVNVCKILNIDNYDINDLPSHKSNLREKGIHYRNYYDEETRIKVYENHKQIFEEFGYEF